MALLEPQESLIKHLGVDNVSVVFPFDRGVVEKAPGLFQHIENSSVEKLVAYLLHSDYRQAVSLEPWLLKQVIAPSDELRRLADNISVGVDDDETVINVLQAVIHRISYVMDQTRWSMPEYWQTAEETLTLNTGDCEDGAVLLYVLCRLKGVPPEKMLLFAGDVIGGGHCWLGYRPICYPLNWVFLDWCYWPIEQHIGVRNFYYVRDKDILGEQFDGSPDTRYKRIWFGFNEGHSVLSLRYHHET